MLYVSKIVNNIAEITNTETNVVSSMPLENLVLCCHHSKITIYGVYKISPFNWEQYSRAGYYVNNVTSEDYYVVYVVDEESFPLDNHEKYLVYKRYLNKCKLTGVKPLAYSLNVDDITKNVGSIGFCLNESSDAWLIRNNIRTASYDSNIDELTLIDFRDRKSTYKVSDLNRFVVPKFVDYISFKAVKSDKPCVIKLPDKEIKVLDTDYLSRNLVLRVPKNFTYLYKDCYCVKLEY